MKNNNKSNSLFILGRILPDSGKIHQNQEIYSTSGICPSLKASTYKDPFKILVEVRNEKSKRSSSINT